MSVDKRVAGSPPRLIVNADDFGMHSSINAAIVEGHQQGIVTSCSLVADGANDAFHEAAALAHANPTLDVGLHFVLVGLPGLPAAFPEFLTEYWTFRFPPSRIEQLLRHQLETLAASGIVPTHIDSHQHLHALPGVMRVVCRVAVEHGIPAIRLPLEQSTDNAPLARIAASKVLGLASFVASAQIRKYGLWQPDHFLGMAASGYLTEDALLRLIDRVPATGVTEILCHPGIDNRALEERYGWGYDWLTELKAVTSEAVKRRVEERGIMLTTFADTGTHPA